jgi:hypothetical protein
MLVLNRSADWYPDDVDPSLHYRLPDGIAPLPDPDGTPQAVLSRGPDGGLLHLRLGATWPTLQPGERRVAFDAGRFRLLLRTPTADQQGRWWPTPVTGNAVVERSVWLDPLEAAIAKHLGLAGGDVVDIDIELTLRGLTPTYPWLASIATATLRARIAALLRAVPARWEDVEAAFLGLTEDSFTWYPLAPRALPPPRDEALRAIAQFAAPTLLTASDAGWTLADGGPARLDLSLAVPRVQTRRLGLRWSFSEFLVAQRDPTRHVFDVAVPAPFVAAEVCIVNDVPLAANGIRSIAVEIRTGGPSGLLRHEFRVGAASTARLRFVRETTDPLSLRWRAQATVLTVNGPAVVDSDEHASGLLVEVNATTLGLNALRFAATADVFVHAATIEVHFGTRVLVLTRTAPEAWAIGRQPPPSVSLTATRSTGEPHALGVWPCGASGLTLTSAVLGVGEFTAMTLRAPPDLDQRAAYLAVQVDGQPWRTVEPRGEITLAVRRSSRLDPAPVRYRTRVVARSADGATRVITESAWHDDTGDVVTLEF